MELGRPKGCRGRAETQEQSRWTTLQHRRMENVIPWEPEGSEETSRAAQRVPSVAAIVQTHERSAPKQSFQLREKNAVREFLPIKFPCQKGIRLLRRWGREKRNFTASNRFKLDRTSRGCIRFVRLIPCRFIYQECSASAKEEKTAKETCSQELTAASRCPKSSKHAEREHRAISDGIWERSHVTSLK